MATLHKRQYFCKYGCGFVRSRKKVVLRHEQECEYINQKPSVLLKLQKRMGELEKAVETLTKELKALKKPKRDELYNINYANDIDDLMEQPDFVKEYWSLLAGNKSKALLLFIEMFLQRTKRFYIASEKHVKIKGKVGKVGNKTYGIDGAITQFTWYALYDAMIPGIVENIQIMYGDRLYNFDLQCEEIQKRIKTDLKLEKYLRPCRSNYDNDIKYRDACRDHKAHKVEVVAHMQKMML